MVDTQTYEVVESHFLRGGVAGASDLASYLRCSPGRGTLLLQLEECYAVLCADAVSAHTHSFPMNPRALPYPARDAGSLKIAHGSKDTTPHPACRRQGKGHPKGPTSCLGPAFRLLPECSLASAYAFALEPQLQQTITCCISAAFEPFVGVFSMQPTAAPGGSTPGCPPTSGGIADGGSGAPEFTDEGSEDGSAAASISVFLTRPLPKDSPLHVGQEAMPGTP